MSWKKQLAASVLASRPASFLWKSLASKPLVILAYHRVLDDDPAQYDFDGGVISATSEGFLRQMRFVRDNFDVTTFHALVELEAAGKTWPKRPLIVTFDDGYVDNYTHAFPVLKEVGVPAVIYVAASHMDSGELFWWDKIAFCVKKSRASSFSYPPYSAEPVSLHADQHSATIASLLRWVKTIPESDKAEFLRQLPILTECAIPENSMQLGWAQIREMSSWGIEFGSHTLTHPVLPNVKFEDARYELVESKRLIEEKTGKRVVSFSYPVGRYTTEIVNAVQEAGYSFGVSYTEEAIRYQSMNRFLLPRVHVEPQVSLQQFQSTVMFPEILLRRNGHSDD